MSVTQQHRSTTDRHKPITRRGRHSTTTLTKLPAGPSADAFLRTRFFPIVIEERQRYSSSTVDVDKLQAEFRSSLQHLANTFDFVAPFAELDSLPYPLNIGHVLSLCRQFMQQINPEVKLILIQDRDHLATLVTTIEREVDYGVYYVPVRPLFYLMRDTRNKARTQLICSIYSYLYRVAKVPYCSEDSGSFISYEYDYMREHELEWSEEDLADAGRKKGEIEAYLEMIDSALVRCRRRFGNKRYLEDFAQNIDRFTPISEADHTLVQVARRFLELYETFPDHSLHQSFIDDAYNENDYGEPPIDADKYISFIWSDRDYVNDFIMENFNAEMSGGSEQAPINCSVVYDRTYSNKNELENSTLFVVHLLDSMAEFIQYICDIDDEQRKQRFSKVLPAQDGAVNLSACS